MPQQAKAADAHLQSSLVRQVASSHRQTSSLITPGTWNPDTGATCHMTPHREWLTHYQPHRVPVLLGDNSVVWSEGVGVCWFGPMLEGSPAPLVHFSNVLYVHRLASNLLSLFTLTALGYTFTGTGHSLPSLQQRGTSPLSSHSHWVPHWPAHRSHPTCSPRTTDRVCSRCCTTHLQLWHERLNHRALDAVERAVQHVEGLTIDSKAHHCPACAAGSSIGTRFLPLHPCITSS